MATRSRCHSRCSLSSGSARSAPSSGSAGSETSTPRLLCVVIPYDARVVDRWAELHARLLNQLKGEGINDLWIAACCLVYDLPVVTGNVTDFGTIQTVAPELRIVHPDG